MLSITEIKEENMNPEYDPARSCNGGGYYQPTIVVAFSDGVQLVIEDTSCGDYGTRYEASMYDVNNARIAEAIYGSMLNIYDWYSTFTRSQHGVYLDLVHGAIGYGVLESEELSDMIAELEEEES